MDFRERTKLKIAISKMKREEKAMNKNNSFKLKRGIGIAACFAIMFSGIVYAKDIEMFFKNLFVNSNNAVDSAVENGYVQNIDNGFVYDNEIGIKVDKLVLDEQNLNISFNYEIKKENVKSVRIKDIEITNDNNKTVFSSEFQYAETKDELPIYNSVNWMNEPVKISDTIYMDSILLGLRPEKEEFKELYINVKSFQVTYTDNNIEFIDGEWKNNITISEDMRKSISKTYNMIEKNNYVESCIGTLSPTGMVVKLKLSQYFDVPKYINDNIEKLNDTGIFYIKYNNELLLPSLMEYGSDGSTLIIHYDNIGLYYKNIREIEMYLLPFETTIKLNEK